MQFKGIYLNAMREKAPAMFNELRRSGKIAAHAREKEREFGRLVNEALTNEPKGQSGLVLNRNAQRQVEEVVAAQLLEFPSEGPERKKAPAL